jgi:hypothetical protein
MTLFVAILMVVLSVPVVLALQGMVSTVKVCIKHHSYLLNNGLLYIPDNDECLLNTSCVNADCINNAGGYSCGPCHPGFERIDANNLTPCCELQP